MDLYQLRVKHDRQSVSLLGGSDNSEAAVASGLDWLARHQAVDGHWGPNCIGAEAGSTCEKDHPCDNAGQPFPVAQTGLAILAFQAGGHYYYNGRSYSNCVRKGLNWLVKNQNTDGALVTSPFSNVGLRAARGRPVRVPTCLPTSYYGSFMYEHGMAAFAPERSLRSCSGRKEDSRTLLSGGRE